MADEQQNEPTAATLQAVQGVDYFTAYANGVGMAHTFFDFQLHFSEVRVKSTQDISAEAFATIMMSPQHAKVLLSHLKQNVESYEAKFGEIKVPENVFKVENVDFSVNPNPRAEVTK